jgi:two-component system response regulator NreC
VSVVRVLIVDDHPVVRAGLRLLLQSEEGFDIVGEAAGVGEALDLAIRLIPDVIILDLGLADGSGLQVLAGLQEAAVLSRTVVLTMYSDNEHVQAALQAGAKGYVLKQSVDTELIAAVRMAARGDSFVDPYLTRSLLEQVSQPAPSPGMALDVNGGPTSDFSQLSERELQVARLVVMGHTNKEIGGKLYLSVKTVETYRRRVMLKLGLDTRAELVQRALQVGLLDGPV